MSGATPRLRRAMELFGLTARDADTRAAHALRLTRAKAVARELAKGARPGTLILISGPSGAGKSTLLRELRRCLPVARAANVPASSSLLSSLPGPLDGEAGVLRTLAAVGLADAAMLGRDPRTLCGGERLRLTLARAMLHRRRGAVKPRRAPSLIIADEFGAALDRPGAIALGAAVRRWVDGPGRRAGLALAAATAHDDLLDALRPDVHVLVGEEGAISVHRRRRDTRATRRAHPRFIITRGTRNDYACLARHHYRPGAPSAACLVLKATAPGVATSRGAPLGVLVVSMPVLNARWRQRAWPGRYTTPDPQENARRLNAEVRCLSRLIVHPRHRGLGVGAALVRAYLADPLTPRTECLAAMGAMCPVFTRAGMREHRLPPPARDAALRRSLLAAGLRGPRQTDAALIARAARARPDVLRALRSWADASRATRRHTRAHPHVLALLAARSLGSRPIAYSHGK